MKRMWDEKEIVGLCKEVHNKLGIECIVVEELPSPEDARKSVIYLLPSEDSEEGNIYEEYILTKDGFELIGTTKIDLNSLGFRRISATEFNNLTAQEKAEAIYKGLIIEGLYTTYDNKKIKNPIFFPMTWNGYGTATGSSTRQGFIFYQDADVGNTGNIVISMWRIEENLTYRISIASNYGFIDLRHVTSINGKSLEGSCFYATLDTTHISTITSTQVTTGWYKNVIAITGGLTNVKDVKVKMSNGYTYLPTGFSASEIVIFSGVDFQSGNISVDTIYYKNV